MLPLGHCWLPRHTCGMRDSVSPDTVVRAQVSGHLSESWEPSGLRP